MLKTLLALTLFAAALGAAPQAGAQPALIAPGKLTYGVAATFAPFEYTKDGKLVGLDIELGDAIAGKMGLTAAPLSMEFAGLIPALLGSRIDVINSGMYINAKREEAVDFVPYLKIGNQIVVRKGNPAKIGSRADLCGKRVAVTLGGIEETYARQDAAKCKEAGKPDVTVMTLPTAQDSALSLRQGRADALFDSTPGAVKVTTELPDVYEIAGPSFEDGTRIGFAVRKGDAALKAALTKAVQEIVADGTYAKLMEKYGFPASLSLF
jgi:polar amino acid transport system substrate-binding protein